MADTIVKRYRPSSYSDPQLNLDLKTAYDQIYAVNDGAIYGLQTDQALASGVTTVTGAANRVVSGLASVGNVLAMVDSGSVGGSTDIVSARPTPNAQGLIDLFVWQSDGVTPSVTPRTVRWLAIGARVKNAQ